jgi:hypothetical protein
MKQVTSLEISKQLKEVANKKGFITTSGDAIWSKNEDGEYSLKEIDNETLKKDEYLAYNKESLLHALPDELETSYHTFDLETDNETYCYYDNIDLMLGQHFGSDIDDFETIEDMLADLLIQIIDYGFEENKWIPIINKS